MVEKIEWAGSQWMLFLMDVLCLAIGGSLAVEIKTGDIPFQWALTSFGLTVLAFLGGMILTYETAMARRSRQAGSLTKIHSA